AWPAVYSWSGRRPPPLACAPSSRGVPMKDDGFDLARPPDGVPPELLASVPESEFPPVLHNSKFARNAYWDAVKEVRQSNGSRPLPDAFRDQLRHQMLPVYNAVFEAAHAACLGIDRESADRVGGRDELRDEVVSRVLLALLRMNARFDPNFGSTVEAWL